MLDMTIPSAIAQDRYGRLPVLYQRHGNTQVSAPGHRGTEHRFAVLMLRVGGNSEPGVAAIAAAAISTATG
jgi:hypothetical protein